MNHWTDETDAEAEVYFGTLTETEIRRRQDLCVQQQRLAYQQRNDRALTDLQRMEVALTAEMLRRLDARNARHRAVSDSPGHGGFTP